MLCLLLGIIIFSLFFPSLVEGTVEGDKLIYISNKEELCGLAERVNGGDSLEGYTVKLTNDINCDSLNEWIPIGKDETTPFKGEFDGQGFAISRLNIDNNKENKYLGLFGITNNSCIKNLEIKDSYITIKDNNKARYIGMIAGKSEGILKNCITFGDRINIENLSNASGEVIAIGGLVGEFYGSSIYRCDNGTIIRINQQESALLNVGGICGLLEGAIEVKKCYNNQEIFMHGSSGYTGGIIGRIVGISDETGIVEDCYNMKSVSALAR